MNAAFDNLDDFLAELKACTGRSVVRASVSRSEVNSGVTDVVVVSGFHDDHYFYELRLECGQEWVGGDKSAAESAEAAVVRIKSFCEEHGYEFRGGIWCRPE
jgi:hypothetical protein